VGARESLKKINIFLRFLYFLWWVKGKNNALFFLGYGIMHATSKGTSSRDIGAGFSCKIQASGSPRFCKQDITSDGREGTLW
jgi:hypothetical protein